MELSQASGPHRCFLPVPSESHDAHLGGSAVTDHHEGKADDEGADRFAEVSFLGGAWRVLCWLGAAELRLWVDFVTGIRLCRF